MQNHFARSSGNGWKRAFSSIVAVLLFCSGLRAQEACPVEIKLLISAPPVKSVIASLGLGNETAGQVYFFDTDNLDLFKQGVILRVRQGTQNDLTVKVRLSDSTQIDRSKLQGHFGCEVDRIGAEAITSFSVGRKYKLQPLPVAGEDILSALSSRQRSLLQEAQVSIDWSIGEENCRHQLKAMDCRVSVSASRTHSGILGMARWQYSRIVHKGHAESIGIEISGLTKNSERKRAVAKRRSRDQDRHGAEEPHASSRAHNRKQHPTQLTR